MQQQHPRLACGCKMLRERPLPAAAVWGGACAGYHSTGNGLCGMHACVIDSAHAAEPLLSSWLGVGGLAGWVKRRRRPAIGLWWFSAVSARVLFARLPMVCECVHGIFGPQGKQAAVVPVLPGHPGLAMVSEM